MKSEIDGVEAVLLCGGESRRLGYPKEMLRVEGAPLAVKITERLKEVFASVSVSSNRPDFLRYCLDVPIHRDEFEGVGPLGGLHAGLKHARTEKCFFLACDMPLVHNDIITRIVSRALKSEAPATIAHADGRMQPLCAVYSRSLLPLLEKQLATRQELSVNRFTRLFRTETVQVEPPDAMCFRDIDGPEDVEILHEAFDDVEPLPIKTVPLTGGARTCDIVAQEWSVAIYVNGLKLVTVLCLPAALCELAAGVAAYLGLVKHRDDIRAVEPDYSARRVTMKITAGDQEIRKAAQLLITSTCGANVYGGGLPMLIAGRGPGRFVVSRTHILDCIQGLRAMAPAFSVTGGTHQAAFSDGRDVRLFFEDIGRHNALDKVLGKALLDGRDPGMGVLVSTGRLSSEMVVKALRQKVPVLASRSAVTTNAIRLAGECGLTLVGFARGERMNIYTVPERVKDA